MHRLGADVYIQAAITTVVDKQVNSGDTDAVIYCKRMKPKVLNSKIKRL